MKKLFTLFLFSFSTLVVSAQLDCDNTLICDDFDSYVTGALGPQADHWTTWSGNEGGAEDGIVSTDLAFSGANSMQIQGQNGPQDVLLLLGNQTSGNFRLDFKMNVFDGQRAYWNHQKDEVPAVQWGQEVHFAEDGSGSLDAGALDAAQFTFPHDEWFHITQFIDLDNDRASLFIAGQAVYDWQFSLSAQGTSTPILQIGALDFFPTDDGNHLYYVDDVRFSTPPGNDVAKLMVQINVDMSLEDVSPDGVNIAGSFNGWTAEPMENIGDGIWQAYVPVDEASDYQYKFVNGASFETGKEECGEDDGFGGFNRTYTSETSSTVVDAVCFNQCVPCSEVSNTNNLALDGKVSVSPNPASDEIRVSFDLDQSAALQIKMVTLTGQVVFQRDLGNIANGVEQFDVSEVPSGIYFLQLNDGKKQLSQKVIVQ